MSIVHIQKLTCSNNRYRIVKIIFINSLSLVLISLQKKHPFHNIYTLIVELSLCVIASLQVLVIVYSVCSVTELNPVLPITQFKGSLTITCFFLN